MSAPFVNNTTENTIENTTENNTIDNTTNKNYHARDDCDVTQNKKVRYSSDGGGSDSEGSYIEEVNTCANCMKEMPDDIIGLCSDCLDSCFGKDECKNCKTMWDTATASTDCCFCGNCSLRKKFCNC
eukprot:3940442-Rhodomonas_salina.2